MICRCRKGARCLACILRDGLTKSRACTCDRRFLAQGVSDVDCPLHGVAALRHDLELPEQAA